MLYALAQDALYAIDDRTSALRRVVGADDGRFTDRNVSALALDAAGRLWVGYFDRGLDILDAQGQRAMHVENDHVFCVNRIVHDAAGGADGGRHRQRARAVRFVRPAEAGPRARRGPHRGPRHRSGAECRRHDGRDARRPDVHRSRGQPQHCTHFTAWSTTTSTRSAPRAAQVLAGTLGGASMLDNGSIRASYTTANSALTHNWITAIARVDDEWFVGTYGGGLVPSRRARACGSRFADLTGPIEINPNAMAVTGNACLRRHAVQRAAGVRPPRAALDDDRVRAAVDERDRARRRWRPSVCRHRQRARSHPAMSRFHRLVLLAVLVAPIPLLGDAGVLIPSGSTAPNPAILSLDQMAVDIRIDNGDARVVGPADLREPSRRRAGRRVSVLDAGPRDGVRLRGVGRCDAHSGRHPRASSSGGDLREPDAAADRSGPAAAGRTRHRGRRGSDAHVGLQRAHRADSRVWHEAARDGVPRGRAGREPAIGVRAAAASRGLQRAVGDASSPSRSAWSPPTRFGTFAWSAALYPLQIREQTANRVAGSFAGRNVTLRGRLQRRVPARFGEGRHARSGDLSQSGAGRAQSECGAHSVSGRPSARAPAPRPGSATPSRARSSATAWRLRSRGGRGRAASTSVEPARVHRRRFVASAMSVGALSPEAHQALTIGIQRAGGAANTGEGGEDPAWYAPGAGRRAARRADQAGRVGAVRRHRDVPRAGRPARDQDRPGLQARRRRPAAGPQGDRAHRRPAPRPAGHDADQPAAAPRHLLDRGSRPAHRRPAGDQPDRADRRQARRQARGRDDRGRRREGRRRLRPLSAATPAGRGQPARLDQARRGAVGARPRGGPPGRWSATACATASSCGPTAASRPAATCWSRRCSAPRSSASARWRSSRSAATWPASATSTRARRASRPSARTSARSSPARPSRSSVRRGHRRGPAPRARRGRARVRRRGRRREPVGCWRRPPPPARDATSAAVVGAPRWERGRRPPRAPGDRPAATVRRVARHRRSRRGVVGRAPRPGSGRRLGGLALDDRPSDRSAPALSGALERGELRRADPPRARAARPARPSARSPVPASSCGSSARPTTTSARACRAARSSSGRSRRSPPIRRARRSPATPACTGRPAAGCTSSVGRGCGSPSGTAGPRRSSRASARTAAST